MKINYKPPPTLREYIKHYKPHELFYDLVVGPVGSGKTTALFFKLVYMASLQEPCDDGIRRSRAVIVRNTAPQLNDTTIVSWNYWFKHGQAGEWHKTNKTFMLRFGDVECEVLFRPLDTPDDVQRVLSLEVTFAILDEFVQIPREIVDALSARCGRYPSQAMVQGGATNWGMWGASNPDTEDNWWFDHLHNKELVFKPRIFKDVKAQLAYNAHSKHEHEKFTYTYYLQPSGFSKEAENIENLPGGRDYYTNQAKGKSEAWIKQFLEAEWGYSAEGKPVVPTFRPDLHVRRGLRFNPRLPLVIGTDPGLGGSALIFGQLDLSGRLNVLGELIQQGYGAERLIKERLRPYLMTHFKDATDIVIAPDPAAYNRSQNDEKAVVDTFRKYFQIAKDDLNNQMPKRLNAIEYFTTRFAEMEPALAVDADMCPVLVRALKGGWKYIIDKKRSVVKAEADKNNYSHPGDGFGYLCRYFHKGAERDEKWGGKRPPIPPQQPNTYFFR